MPIPTPTPGRPMPSTDMNRTCAPVLDFLTRNEHRMFSLLREMVLIQTGSFNKRGIDSLVALIMRSMEGGCIRFRRIHQVERGDHLIALSPPASLDHARGILITGHTDTVFPEDTPFDWYREDELHAYGPGVIDMKGGLVCGIFALKALDQAGLLNELPVRFIFNSDEEIGSPSSGGVIAELAQKSAYALVLECGGLDGGVVTGRKGKLGLRVDVEGEAGHAAFAGLRKPSAILELAHKTIALEELNESSGDITLNVGGIEGGIGPNTVPRHACARVDIRYVSPLQRRRILERVERIVQETSVPGTTGNLWIESERPPMPRSESSRRLFQIARSAGASLGIDLCEEFRSGVSDANLIASLGTPVLDGLGPIGALDHSDKEYMIKTSLLERAKLLALILVQISKHPNP